MIFYQGFPLEKIKKLLTHNSRTLAFFIAVVCLPVLFCAKLGDEHKWDNALDPSGTNYFPPEIIFINRPVFNIYPFKAVDFNISAIDNEDSITGYFWSLDNGITWKSTGKISHISASWDTASLGPRKILAYVTDNHNLKSRIDTINVLVLRDEPIINPVKDTSVSQSITFKQDLTGQNAGGLLKYYWDVNMDGWDDSLIAEKASCAISKPEGGSVYVHWAIKDESNFVKDDTFMVYFNKKPFKPKIVFPVSDTIKKFISYDYSQSNGSVLIECTASDPDDMDSTLTFTLRYGLKDGNSFETTTASNRKFNLNSIKELSVYSFVLTVEDRYFNTDSSTGQFIVLPPSPKPEGMKFVLCQNAVYLMGQAAPGDSTALPVHSVTFSNNFWIDTTEISTEKFAKILSLTQPQTNSARLPVTNITWFDAVLFCNARSKYHHLDTVYKYSSLTGTPGSQCKLENVTADLKVNGYRLPTEAEWEFACRGGTSTLFFWGNDRGIASEYAWTFTPAESKIHDVATLKPNALVLYDMAGNVWEWCNDWYGLYQKSPTMDPSGALSGNERVLRGGSAASSNFFAQSGIRSKLRPETYNAFTGFRTVLPAVP
jgi:formylglycine-generating enzyme required for sulfatase activity